MGGDKKSFHRKYGAYNFSKIFKPLTWFTYSSFRKYLWEKSEVGLSRITNKRQQYFLKFAIKVKLIYLKRTDKLKISCKEPIVNPTVLRTSRTDRRVLVCKSLRITSSRTNVHIGNLLHLRNIHITKTNFGPSGLFLFHQSMILSSNLSF